MRGIASTAFFAAWRATAGWPRRWPWAPAAAAAAAAGAGDPAPPGRNRRRRPLPTQAQAARFLRQATFGPTAAEIDRVTQIGYARWLDEQMALPATLHEPAVPRFADPFTPKLFGIYPIQSSFWRQAATAPDQLRQRLMFALSEIFVVSVAGHERHHLPARRRLVHGHARRVGSLGNYRQLLEGVALHPMMGLYLSHLGNRKEDPASGRVPDENFAREVMQLFSIGTRGAERRRQPPHRRRRQGDRDLRQRRRHRPGEGLHRLELARARADRRVLLRRLRDPVLLPAAADPERDIKPMRFYPQHHSSSEKRFLGTTIAAEHRAPTSLKIALDRLASHPNVGPFIGRQLIQRLVSSNPSPAYVGRVAGAFADNGQGVRGDMKAVVRAVLLDPEARADPDAGRLRAGKLREPILRITAWMRAFNVRSISGDWAYYFTGDPVTSIGQTPLQSPSVFNFFRPGYVPPQSEAGRAGLVVPEMQITSETTVASYLNVVESTVGYFGTGFLLDLNTDYAAEMRAGRRSRRAGRAGEPAARRRRHVGRDQGADARGGRVGAVRLALLPREPGPAGGAVRDGVHRFPGREVSGRHDDHTASRRAFLRRARQLSLLGGAAPFALNLAARRRRVGAGRRRLQGAGVRVPVRRQRLGQHRDPVRRGGVCRYRPRAAADRPGGDAGAAARSRPASRRSRCRPSCLVRRPLQRRPRGDRRQRRAAGRPATRAQLAAARWRCRPSCSRTTTSSRPGRRPRPKARSSAGAAGSATWSPPAMPTRPSPACRSPATRSGSPARRRRSTRSPAGAVTVNSLANASLFGSATASQLLRRLVTEPRTHVIENDHTRLIQRGLTANQDLRDAMAGMPELQTVFPDSGLAAQLKMAARLIAARNGLGAKRQVILFRWAVSIITLF